MLFEIENKNYTPNGISANHSKVNTCYVFGLYFFAASVKWNAPVGIISVEIAKINKFILG